jgi:hypothetical protein
MISLYTETRPNLPHWLKDWVPPKPEIALKVKNPAALAELPAGQHGRGRLQIHPADLEAGQQLVESILRASVPPRAAPGAGPAGPVVDSDRVRKQLRGPAWGLLLTAAAALAWTVGPAVVAAQRLDRMENVTSNRVVFAVATVLALVGVPPLFAGAVQMLRRRTYPLCVAAALVAVLPWSPAWLAGLPVGIWALVVLSRREVILAFLRESNGSAPEPPREPPLPGPVAGKLRSWWLSFAGYFVTNSHRFE